MSETQDQTLQRICEEVEAEFNVDLSGLALSATKAVARRYAATVGAGEWQHISTVPEGVEVVVRGGRTVFGDEQRGSRIAIIDDRADLYRPDGTLSPLSPTMWHPAPAPPSP